MWGCLAWAAGASWGTPEQAQVSSKAPTAAAERHVIPKRGARPRRWSGGGRCDVPAKSGSTALRTATFLGICRDQLVRGFVVRTRSRLFCSSGCHLRGPGPAPSIGTCHGVGVLLHVCCTRGRFPSGKRPLTCMFSGGRYWV